MKFPGEAAPHSWKFVLFVVEEISNTSTFVKNVLSVEVLNHE